MTPSPPPHIAILVPSLRGGGAERVAVELANRLAVAGLRVDLLLVNYEGPYANELRPEVNVVDFGKDRAARCVLPLARYLREHRPATLLSFLNHVNILAIIAKKLARIDTRLIVSERNSLVRFRSGTLNRVLRTLTAIFYPMADGIIAVSQDMKLELTRDLGIAGEKIVAIPNPVDADRISQMATQIPKHSWIRDEEIRVVLALGRLSPQKNFPVLFQAFRRVLQSRQVKLVVLGEGPMRASLEELAADLGITDHVDLVGFQSNPFGWMAGSSVFVSASAYEGFPNALVQAMACGLPIVSTDCPTGPREILEGGRWGRLVPVNDIEALATAMIEALDDPAPPDVRTRLEAYRPEQVLRQYSEVLQLPYAGT
ncbi:MAG: glycosyltransferase [Salinarimonas sp.]|nr:glycosyltransferase [Salinarimonas sp.]